MSASMALVRALSAASARDEAQRPHRVLSASLIDRMKTIHEDQPLTPSPIRKKRGQTFAYGTTPPGLTSTPSLKELAGSDQFVYNPRASPVLISKTSGRTGSRESSSTSGERRRLLSHREDEERYYNHQQQQQQYECCDETTCHKVQVLFLALMTVVSMVAQIVSLPLFMDAMSHKQTGSDAFVASFTAAMWQPAIFFLLIFFFIYIQNPRNVSVFLPTIAWSNVAVAGVLGGLSTILVAFTSLPNRTDPGVQAILQQMSVPFTVFTRFVVLRKGINRRQAICLFTLAIGIFITLEPTIFGITDVGPKAYREESNPHAWYYYFIYGLSQLPLAFSYALMEQGQKHAEVESMAYIAWYQLFLLFSYVLFVWIDFIPGFGMAMVGPSTFFEKLANGLLCFYATDSSCSNVAPLAAVFTLSTAGTTLFSILLIRYAEGAVFTVIVMTFATPFTTLFWTLFSPEGVIHWAPRLDLSAAFLLVGVAIMTPSVVMYAYFRSDTGNGDGTGTGSKTETEEECLERKKREIALAHEAERIRLRKERARRSRRQRRHNTVASASGGRRYSQSEILAANKSLAEARNKKGRPIPRVKSAPTMIGSF